MSGIRCASGRLRGSPVSTPATSLRITSICAWTIEATSDESMSLSPKRISSTATVSFSLMIGITPEASSVVMVCIAF